MPRKKMLIATSALALLVLGFAVIPALRAQDATDGATKPQPQERVFEMRTYYASPGKFEALQKRFREHTLKLFEKHGITNIGYWTPIEGQKGHGEVLVYILAYPDAASKKKTWDAFGADPEWKKVKSESEADKIPLAAKVESVMLKGTDYSPIK
jgi:hypothetical protein